MKGHGFVHGRLVQPQRVHRVVRLWMAKGDADQHLQGWFDAKDLAGGNDIWDTEPANVC